MGGGLPLESVKIKITTNNYEEPVSKSLLTSNTPMALLTHPFPSAPLCLASSSQVVAVAATTHGLSEPLQLRAGPTEPRSDAASARREPVPTGTGWEQLPAGSEACHSYKAPISGALTWCGSQNGSGETRTAGVKARRGSGVCGLPLPPGPPPFPSGESNM